MKKVIRWGILSAANISSKVIPAIKKSKNATLVAIASRSYERASIIAKKYTIDTLFDSYEELLNSDLIDAVYIPLINNLHFKWSYEALKRGISVLCEKPFTLNSNEAKKLIDFAKANGLLIREGFMYQFHPQYKLVKRLIKNGKIGKLKNIYAVFTFENEDRDSYILKSRFGGGSLMDVGCYCIHLFRMLTESEPDFVLAYQQGKDVDTSMTGILSFGKDTRAIFESSITEFERHLVIIRGEKGEIELKDPWVQSDRTRILFKDKFKEQNIILPYIDTYQLEIEDFSKILLNRRRNKIDLYDPYYNMRIIDALKKSAKSNKIVFLR